MYSKHLNVSLRYVPGADLELSNFFATFGAVTGPIKVNMYLLDIVLAPLRSKWGVKGLV